MTPEQVARFAAILTGRVDEPPSKQVRKRRSTVEAAVLREREEIAKEAETEAKRLHDIVDGEVFEHPLTQRQLKLLAQADALRTFAYAIRNRGTA